MKNIVEFLKTIRKDDWMHFTVSLLGIGFWVLAALVIFDSCEGRRLKKENEQLREELAHQQQYVPLQRDTIRDTVEVVTQKIIEVEKVKNVLTKEDRELLQDLKVKVGEIESLQKLSIHARGEVTLATDTSASQSAMDGAASTSDTVLTYRDRWAEFSFAPADKRLTYSLSDSLDIVVRREYKHRFLWWRWGVKGYEVKAVNFNPHSTIRYSTFVKAK